MRIINCCGYGNTGCTAQTDFLYDHKGVMGALKPFHELGFLKCYYSFGGMLLSVKDGWENPPKKEEVRRSLQGVDPLGAVPLTDGARAHLNLRSMLARQYGDVYSEIVDNALSYIPENYSAFRFKKLIPIMRKAVGEYIKGLVNAMPPGHYFNGEFDPNSSVIGFKNDPPGAYPLFATLLLGGQTSAILRDPRDTTYDFNRHYGLGHSMQTVKNHCAHYNAQLNSARRHIEQFGKEIQPFYKVVEFEKLIQSAEYREEYLHLMVGSRPRIRKIFDPEKSMKNIGMWNNMPSEFVEYVEKNCLENYTQYRKFLETRDMLL